MFAVECQDVRVRYGRKLVLDRVQFQLRPGITCLIGRNGAGKTTLFRVLSGILRPESGRVLLQGVDPFAQPAHKQAVAYLTHRPSLYPQLTIEQNLQFWARVLGLDWPAHAARAHGLARRFGFAHKLGLRAGTLSRGQQQRVAIARLLLAQPSVILMDEPATGLDALGIRELHDLVHELAAEGVSAIYATHALDEAVRLGGQFLLLAGGKAIHLDRREEELAGAEAVTLKVAGAAEPILRQAGLPFEREGDLHVVKAAAFEALSGLLATLVEADCRIVSVERSARLEERLLQHLAELG